jgi:phospholipid transport system substrate-binding protein
MSTTFSRRHLLWLAPAVAASLLHPALLHPAGAQTPELTAPIQALDDAILQIMHAGAKTAFGERAKLVAPAIQAAFDLPQILKTSIGTRWSSLPVPQQIELTEVFRRYTVGSYVANFNGFSGEKFEILPKTRAVGGDQVVETRIVSPGGDTTRIDYVMRKGPEGWKAVDVLLDGSISRVAVQRSDFRALLGAGDATRLIASLRTKTEALEAGGKT